MADDRAPGRRQSQLSEEADIPEQKRAAAQAAAELIEDGMRLGLGTGTTVAHLLPAIAARASSIVCVTLAVIPSTGPSFDWKPSRVSLALSTTSRALVAMSSVCLAIAVTRV